MMVAVVISLLAFTGVVVSLNNYYSAEKVNIAADEVKSILAMTRNIAVTNQITSGFNDALDFVSMTFGVDSVVKAYPNGQTIGVGTSYFVKDVSDDDVSIEVSGDIRFKAGTGRLVDSTGAPLPFNTVIEVLISSPEIGTTKSVRINALGIIK
jgi:hypothetical protein